MTSAVALTRGGLSLAQARRLGSALAQEAGAHLLTGEVASLAAATRPDGSWAAGTLLVRDQRVGFVAREVPGLQVGRTVTVEGRWEHHPEYGVQLDIRHCRKSSLPSERQAVVRYLAANVGGLGARRAEALAMTFGEEDLLSRLAADPEMVRQVLPRAASEKAVLGLRQWARDLSSERWCVDLVPKLMAAADVGYALARRVVSYFDAPEVADLIARRDTYRLLEVPGFGWKRADSIARALGVPVDAPERYEAAVLAAHDRTTSGEGHTGVPISLLVDRACRLAGGTQHSHGVRQGVLAALQACDLVRDGDLLSRPRQIERDWIIADLVVSLAVRTYVLRSDERRAVERVIADARLTAEQGEAVRLLATRGLSVLTGGPGTGKTHTLRAVLDAAAALSLEVTVAAPTGKAATRAAEMTRRSAMTVHRLLGGAPGSMRERGPLTGGVVVVEEASMVDAEVMAWLAQNIRPGGDFRLLIVGDENQLPSVGAGRVLADLLVSGRIPTTRLSVVQRQAAGSRIVVQAHRILAGEALLEEETHDWTHTMIASDAVEAQGDVIRTVRRVIAQERGSLLRAGPFDPRRALQVLTPRVSGPLGVTELNRVLRSLLNPAGVQGPWISGGERVAVNDRVTCIANDYTVKPDGLMNGEQGVVVEIQGDAVQIALDDGRTVMTRGVQNANLALAFASTVHRSQGSEYPVVVFVYHSAHEPLLDQRVLYTAITRAKDRVVLCTDGDALQRSRQRGRTLTRHSALGRRLAGMTRTAQGEA